MLRTLFLIPHEIASIPVLGLGWALGILVAALMLRLGWAKFRRNQWSPDDERGPPSLADVLAAEGVLWGLAAVLVVFVLPNIEVKNVAGERIGMAIRGYGVMLVIAVSSATALAAYRVKRAGMNPEWVYSLAPPLLIGGIVGARLFFIIQYRDRFIGDTIGETVGNMLAFTEGGLVVYGSLIVGFLVFLIYSHRNKIPVLRFADAIIPCVFLGIFFGRIGCLMNGCCYGGRCDDGLWAIEFPPATMVYHDQLQSGELLGMRVDPKSGKILDVAGDSLAMQGGVPVNGIVEAAAPMELTPDTSPMDLPAEDVKSGWLVKVSGKIYPFSAEELPSFALPVRAAQPISSACGLALCGLLCLASRYIRREGALTAIGFGAYAVVRFGLEIVRVDEGGQFNTALTISQWVSVAVLCTATLAVIWIYSRSAEDEVANVG